MRTGYQKYGDPRDFLRISDTAKPPIGTNQFSQGAGVLLALGEMWMDEELPPEPKKKQKPSREWLYSLNGGNYVRQDRLVQMRGRMAHIGQMMTAQGLESFVTPEGWTLTRKRRDEIKPYGRYRFMYALEPQGPYVTLKDFLAQVRDKLKLTPVGVKNFEACIGPAFSRGCGIYGLTLFRKDLKSGWVACAGSERTRRRER